MSSRLIATFLVLPAVAGLSVACGSSNDENSNGGTVTVRDIGIKVNASTLGAAAFNPDTFTVSFATKQRVVWTNLDRTGSNYGTSGVTHHLVSDTAGVFDSGSILGGKNFGFTFAAPGVYPYHCSIHPTMVGTVILTP